MSHQVTLADVLPDLPMPDAPVARICVLGSLNFPQITDADVALVKRFTRLALTTLIELGASYELLDTTDALENPTAAGEFDGLLLLGGGDIDGTCYGVTAANPKAYGTDKRADDDALAAIGAAVAAERPVFGICRGIQLLNVARGGTILGDIEDFVFHHGAPGEPEFVDETVNIVPGTRLSAILGADRVVGRSGHHQAVDRVGEGLVVSARALDGLVEGIEDPRRFYLGVQWHPEDEDGPAEDRRKLFSAFVTAATQARAVRVAAAG